MLIKLMLLSLLFSYSPVLYAGDDVNKDGQIGPSDSLGTLQSPKADSPSENLHTRIDMECGSENAQLCEDEPTTEYEYSCTSIGNGLDDGFFSLEVYMNKLYAGGFGYKGKHAMFRYPEWEVVNPGITVTESVCDMREFKGYLYANTESNGEIYRTADGENWIKVFAGDGRIGCVLRELNGYLYAAIHSSAITSNGKIYRSFDGLQWEVVYDSGAKDEYMKEIIVFNGTLFAFYVDKTTGVGGYFTSPEGINWTRHELGQLRLFKGLVWNGELWAGSSAAYTLSGKSGVWKYDGQTFVNVAEIDGYSHIGELLSHDGNLFATATKEWKGYQGEAALLLSRDKGKHWERACTFSETEAWNIAEFEGDLYVTTKQHHGNGQAGKVYKLEKKKRGGN